VPLIVTRESAKAAVQGELDRLDGDPPFWCERKLLCAIEAIRRGDHEMALDYVIQLRRGPVVGEAGTPPGRLLLTKAKLQRMLDAL
jgi:hypothetical protein